MYENLENEIRALLNDMNRSARNSTWKLLAGALATLLFGGYVYSQIIPALDLLGIPAMTGLATLRLACVLGACLALLIAMYCGLLLTGQLLVVEEASKSNGTGR